MAEISLALGGGGIKGIAHIGVLKVLESNNIQISAIAGTSAGGVVGALYAAGYTPDEIEDMITGIDQKKLFTRQANDGPSLMGLSGLIDILNKVIGDRSFADLKLPFAVTAVDIRSNQEFIITKGKITDAILATAAVPGVFPPQHIGEAQLVDGGVLDPVPVAVARWLKPKLPVVAIALNPAKENWAELNAFHIPPETPIPRPIIDQIAKHRIGQAFSIFLTSMDITSRMITELRLEVEKPEVIIRPDVSKFGFLDNVNPAELIEAGIIAAQAAIPQINQSLSWYNQISRQFQNAPAPGKLIAEDDSE